MKQETHLVPMQAGGHVALHRYSPANPIGLPVVVAHGTLSNQLAVEHLGAFFAVYGRLRLRKGLLVLL